MAEVQDEKPSGPTDLKSDEKGGVEQKPQATVSYLVVRKSAFFLAVELTVVEVVFLLILIVLLLPFVTGGPGLDTGFNFLLSAVLFIGALVKVGITLWVTIRWLNEFYEIFPAEIICHSGVFTKRREVFGTKDVKSMSVTQDLVGRFFRYGSLRLYNPALNQEIVMSSISNPNKHLEMVSQMLPQLEKQATFIRSGGVQTN